MVGAAAPSSCYASPLCTWFVAACMSVSHGGGDSRQAVALKSVGRSRRSRRQLIKCLALSGSGSVQEALVTSFGPCNNSSNALSSLFGSNSVSLNRNQRRLNRAAASSGNITFSLIWVFDLWVLFEKLISFVFVSKVSLFLCFLTQVLVRCCYVCYVTWPNDSTWRSSLMGKYADLESQLKYEV